jgi:transglutaminase-like putative cysteine protease
MSWRISINHVSTYRYASAATASYNEVRMTPVSFGAQTLLDARVSTSPVSSLFRYRDYFGTTVHAFDIHDLHDELVVVGASTVDTALTPPVESELTFADLRTAEVEDRFSEYLLASAYANLDDELTTIAHDIASGHSPAETVIALCGFVRDRLQYLPGSTIVTTSAVEAWVQKSGVCQDFAHLSLALLRAVGVPARYVSGYLHPNPECAIGEAVQGASHAWIEAWLGQWCGLDPTNGRDVDEQHVTVARGRDYSDVTPFRGIYHGGRLQDLNVSVDITRLA